ncbi:unnamed protein product [Lactuca saligna]|uniref:CRC domain-containing protein n=1 Tax=Lactuca saligna TaxID=75948 RepID=A0AA36EB38_LACSI|nr:unnamed protein product [Lactuca saligna]
MATKSNIDTHKCCKCKTTKCLKLYCGCFAAESYCPEACSCKECCNLLDYEDTVQVAHQQAKVRNPLAFSTKKDKDRNKIGCECKLSMCLKESCKCNKLNLLTLRMIGTSKTDYDLDLPTLDQLELMNQFTSQDLDQFEFMNQSTSQYFNVRNDEMKK